jgi:glycosyltransferase involved in cell wall biosynthesis
MNITFVMANPSMSGGDRVCAIYAQKLNALGHKVSIIAPKQRFLSIRKQIRRMLSGDSWLSKKVQMQSHFDLLGLSVTYATDFLPLKDKHVPDADVVIATWWETAEWVNDFMAEKGKKVYFIQHYEVFDHLPIDRVEKTYRLPFYKVVIANWLVSIMEEKYKSDRLFLVPNSVEHELFHADVREKQGTPTIGFLFSESLFKGVNVALKVIQNLKATIPNLRVIAFGAHSPVNISVPDYVELSINPPQDEIRLLYQQCDLWLCCSLSEGFGLTILEAMACRVPAVSTKCGGPEDIVTDASNGYLCDVNDVECLTSAAHKVLSFSDEEWLAFSDKAYQHASEYTWDDAAKLFEEALQKVK